MIKSRQRVKDLGEVFTADREVNAMLDLVKGESYRIDSRFLEPSCGTGNFIVKIIERKMTVVNRSSISYEHCIFNTLVAVSSVYGVDICPDNVKETKMRVKSIILENFKVTSRYFRAALNYILDHNIILGDMLNGRDAINFIEYKTPKIMHDYEISTSDDKSSYIDPSLFRFRLVEFNVNDLDAPLRTSRLVSMRGIPHALERAGRH